MCASKPWRLSVRASVSAPVTVSALRAGLLICVLLTGSAWAEQTPSREQEQLRRMRQQLQQLQQQQTSDQDALRRADTDKAAAKAQADAALAELRRMRASATVQARSAAELQATIDALHTEGDALKASGAQLRSELASSQAGNDKLRGELSVQQRNLVQQQAALADLQSRHQTQAQGLQVCIANNQALHELGLDLLQRYASKGVAEVLGQHEPFVQTRRVALENLLQDYRDKLDLQALKPAAAGAAGMEAGRAP